MNTSPNDITVSGLARELHLTAGEVIDLCERLDIDAAWGGAEIGASDADRIRKTAAADAELLGLPAPTPVDAAIPPTAVGSAPQLIEEEEAAASTTFRSPFAVNRDVVNPMAETPEGAPGRVISTRAPRRLHVSVRSAVISLALAVSFVAAGQFVRVPVLVMVLWLLAALAALAAAVSGNRARYDITNHPDKHKGLVLSLVSLLGGVLVIAGIGYGVFLAVREAPAKDAPLIGSTSSVERVRYGYQRFQLVRTNDWHSPGRPAGSCWRDLEKGRTGDRAALDRDELDLRSTDCGVTHTYEVVAVYGLLRRADVPFDRKALRAAALDKCSDEFGDTAPAQGSYVLEGPSEASWQRGDRDFACLVKAERTGRVRAVRSGP